MTSHQKHNELFQNIFESSYQAILVADRDGTITQANPAACHFFAFAKAQLIGTSIEAIIPKINSIEEIQDNIWTYKKDGSQALVNLQIQTIHNNDIAKTILYISDATDSLIYKWVLKENQDNILNTESEGKVGSWYWVFDTDERYWSDEFYKICGLSAGDPRLTAETALSFIHPDDREMAIAIVTKTIEEHIPYTIEKRIVQPDGAVRDVIARGRVDYDLEGKPFRMSGTMRDVSAIKKEKLENIESNRKYETLINNLNGIVYSCQNNLEYTMDYINEGCYSITGYTSDDFMTGTIHYGDIIVDKDRVYVWKKIQEALSQKKHFDISYSIKCKNGAIKYLREIGCGVFNNSNSKVLLEGFITDITEQTNSQKQLQENIDKNTALLYAIPDMMFVQDKAGTFLEFHAPNSVKLLVPRDQIIGNNMKDILPPDVYKSIQKAQKEVYKKKQLAVVAYDLIVAGETVYYEARIVPLNGTKVLTIVRDVTQEIIIKKELEESKEELKIYAQLLEEKVGQRTEELTATVEQLVTSNLNLEDQIKETGVAEKEALASRSLSIDIARNFPNGFIIVFNPEFEIVLKEGEAIHQLKLDKTISEGMKVDDITFFSKNQKKQLKQDILNTLSGEHLNFEVSYKNRPFSVNTKPLADENAKISSAFFVYNDISEQKRIALEIQNALKKEQELNELKSRFISMASHEFRTPLSAIQTSAILIGKQNEVGKEEKRMKYVNQIKNNVKNLVVILNDFLSLSKLEEGKVIPNKEVFDFIDFSKTIIKELSITKKIGQDIIFSSSEDTLLINLDPKLMRHILINLLSNAIKYSPENSQINIKINKNKQVVSLEIQDQGIGIPEEEQEKLFERFFRAKNVQNIEGTGLGLNIVKQFVALMDGTIEFKSKPNEGSTFLVKWAKPNNK